MPFGRDHGGGAMWRTEDNEKNDEIWKLKKRVEELENKNAALKIADLERENKYLRNEVEKYRKKYETLINARW